MLTWNTVPLFFSSPLPEIKTIQMKLYSIFPGIFFCLLAMASLAQSNEGNNSNTPAVGDTDALYIGGTEALMNFIASEIKYPQAAVDAGLSGTVYVSFVVNEEGKIASSNIARGVDPLLDREAMRVIMLTDKHWNPAVQNNKKTASTVTVPIRFALD